MKKIIRSPLMLVLAALLFLLAGCSGVAKIPTQHGDALFAGTVLGKTGEVIIDDRRVEIRDADATAPVQAWSADAVAKRLVPETGSVIKAFSD